LRPGAQLREGSHVGNFVELKKTVLGKGSKGTPLYLAMRSSAGVNVGRHHHLQLRRQEEAVTTIEDGAFIGWTRSSSRR